MARGDKGYEKAKGKTEKAAGKHDQDKKNLINKMAAKGGSGKLTRKERQVAKTIGECPFCDGTGKFDGKKCPGCNGSGSR